MPVLLKVVHTSAEIKGDSKPAWGPEASLSLHESVSVGSREWALGVPCAGRRAGLPLESAYSTAAGCTAALSKKVIVWKFQKQYNQGI